MTRHGPLPHRLRPLTVVGAALFALATAAGGAVVAASPDVPDDTAAEPAVLGALPGNPGEALPPDGLGDDPKLDELASSCFDGDLLSCDLLFLQSPVDSAYETYGDSCGGRSDTGTGTWCALGRDGDSSGQTGSHEPDDSGPDDGTIPPPTMEVAGLGDDERLNERATDCYDGDMQACDDLYRATDGLAGYEDYLEFADTCAGRQDVDTGRYCALVFPGTPGDSPDTEPAITDPAVTEPSVTEPPSDTQPIPSIVLPTVPTIPFDPNAGDSSVPVDGPEVPSPTIEPTGLGDDPVLDELAQSCYDGLMEACDDLWSQSMPGTDYRSYGDTCAGRQAADSGWWCTDSFGEGSLDTIVDEPDEPDEPETTVPSTSTPMVTTTVAPSNVPEPGAEPTGLGSSAQLDALAQACYDGDLASCDDLFDRAPIGSDYHRYGDTCAERQPAGTFVYCVAAFDD